tara:strand:- start:293 stop:886 length:594 start_codon:yes stop_codon:yes gene_type:complete
MSNYVESRGIFSNTYSLGAMATKQDYILTFTHTATGHNVSFPATIQNFSDTHTTQISEQIFADRMDPLIQQASTTRDISFSFVVVNSSIDEARYNERSINLLLQMMYPKLANNGTVEAGSYIEVSGLNFFQNFSSENSITCLIQNMSYSLNVDEGFITPTAGEIHPISITIDISAVAIIPKSDNQKNPYPDSYPGYR